MATSSNANLTNVEDLTIVWLDASINQVDDNQLERKVRVRQIIDYLKSFDDSDACVHYITSVRDEKVLLIVSGTLGESVVPRINDLPHVLCIYVLCELQSVHEQWARNYAKIRGIFVDINQLLVKITEDASVYQRSITPLTIFSKDANTSLRDLDKDSAAFMWSQLFMQVLLQMPQNPQAKENMLRQCRSYYKGNVPQLAIINEFDNTYQAQDAIKWYTRPCFLFNQLNKAFRTDNMDEIFKFRFFIYDLYRQLLKLYEENKINSTIQNVYRGQLLSIQELERLKQNEGKFVSLTTFFSTSTSCEVAINYAGNGEHRSIGFESVFFDIDITGDSNNNKLFSSIKNCSYITDENEVLLSVGLVFLIESVYELTDTIWCVKLNLHLQIDKQISRLLGFWRGKFHGSTTLFHYAKILEMMGDLDKAEAYILLFFEELKTLYDNDGKSLADNPALVAKKYLTIGELHSSKGDFAGALAMFRQVLEIEGSSSTIRAQTLNNIGQIYARQNNFTVAMEKIQQALTEIENTLEPCISTLASIYSNFGHAYSNCSDHENAEKMYLKYLELLLRQSLPSIHPQIAVAYSDVAIFNYGKGDFSTAIENLKTALEISLKSLPSNYRRLCCLYNNIGLLYYAQGRNDDALASCEKVFDIVPFVDQEITTTYVIIGLCFMNKYDFILACQNLKKAEENEKRYFSEDHSTFKWIYGVLGLAYAKIGNYEAAVDNMKKAVDIALQTRPLQFEILVLMYMDIISLYCKIKNYELAYKYFFLARTLLRDFSINEDHPVMLKYFYTLGNLVLSSGNKDYAIVCFQKAVSLAAKSSSNSDFELLGSLHEDIGYTMIEKNELQNGFDHFQKALEYFLVYLPDSHQRLSSIYGLIAQIHTRRQESSKGLEMCQKSLEIQLKAKVPNKKLLQNTYALLGQLYGEPSSTVVDYDKALTNLDVALEIALNFESKDILELVKLYINIGTVHNTKEDLSAALKCFEKALGFAREMQPVDTECLKIIYPNMGGLYEKLGDYESAKTFFQETIKIWPLNDTSLGDYYYELAVVNIKAGSRLEGIDILKQAIDLKLQEAVPDKSALAVCYSTLAEAYELIDDNEKSFELYQKALEFALEVAPAGHESIVLLKDKIRAFEQKTTKDI